MDETTRHYLDSLLAIAFPNGQAFVERQDLPLAKPLDLVEQVGNEALSRDANVSVNLFFTSFAKQARRSRKGGFTGCANVFSPIPVTA